MELPHAATGSPFRTALFAATNGFLTPLDHVSVLVYGPGKYRFTDFVKVGGVITVIIFVIAMILVPLVWPLSH